MELTEFSGKVERAANLLRVLCSDGEPSEEQVKHATMSAGLPVWRPRVSYMADPVRFAVFMAAYKPYTVDKRAKQLEAAHKWREAQGGSL